MSKLSVVRKTHFHIRWLGVKRLDWEPFQTREQAEERAKQLARPEETFVIEEHDRYCARCAARTAAVG